MTETTYLPEVECIVTVENGLLDTQVIAVPDETGNRQYLRVGKGDLSKSEDKSYLPIWVVQFENKGQRALVELPQEADSGTRRIWVRCDKFRLQQDVL